MRLRLEMLFLAVMFSIALHLLSQLRCFLLQCVILL